MMQAMTALSMNMPLSAFVIMPICSAMTAAAMMSDSVDVSRKLADDTGLSKQHWYQYEHPAVREQRRQVEIHAHHDEEDGNEEPVAE